MRTVASTAAIVLLAAVSGMAHHTVANSFDVSKLVALTGTVTAVDWKNPHVIYHVRVRDASGAVIEWEIESRHLEGMRRANLAQGTIKADDRVTMKVMLARDGSHHAATASIALADGRTFDVCTVTNNACPS